MQKCLSELKLNVYEKWLPAHQPLSVLAFFAFPVRLYFHLEPCTVLPFTAGIHSLTVVGGCVSSLLPVELHGGKKLLIDFPFCGMVSLRWFLAPGQQCIQLQLQELSMPSWAVLLTHQHF